MISVSIGYPQTLLSGVTYALPGKVVFIKSNQILQTSLDGTNWITYFQSITTGFQTTDPFIRAAFANAVVEIKKGVKGYIEDGGINFTTEGLKIWLQANLITGLNNSDPLVTWNDVSGNGFNFTQATVANQPLYKTNVLNGLPVVRFDAAGTPNSDHLDIIPAGLVLSNNVSGISFFMVLKITGVANGREFFISAPATNNTTRFSVSNVGATNALNLSVRRLDAVAAATANSAGGVYTNNIPFIHSIRMNYVSQIATQYVNGTNIVTSGALLTSGNTEATDSLSTQMGAGATGASGLPGDIAELIVFNTAISDTLRQQIERYLGAKYAITVA